MRTPLTVLKGELELAERPGRSRAELARTISVVAAETERLISLSERLLLLATADHGLHLRQVPTDVVALTMSAINAHQAQAGRAEVDMRLSGAASAIAVVDPIRLRQVLDNLFSNALRYAPYGSALTISVETLDGANRGVSLSVADEGPGFAPGFLAVAFERFRRADEARSRDVPGDSTTPRSGDGLGLAIVKSIVTAHGGSVSARNGPHNGAIVTFSLPGDAGPDPDIASMRTLPQLSDLG